MRNTTIGEVMTARTETIGGDQSMANAAERMRARHIRHLPVLHGGELVGILSERDLAMVESLPGVDPETVTVREAMRDEPYAVDVATRVAEVVATMADRRYGAVIVTKAGEVAGIFTTVDALRILARELGAG